MNSIVALEADRTLMFASLCFKITQQSFYISTKTDTHTPVARGPMEGMSKAGQLAADKRLIHLMTLTRAPPSIAIT